MIEKSIQGRVDPARDSGFRDKKPLGDNFHESIRCAFHKLLGRALRNFANYSEKSLLNFTKLKLKFHE